MRGLRLSGLLLSCVASAVLLTAGALLLALSPWVPGLRWAAGVMIFIGAWEGR